MKDIGRIKDSIVDSAAWLFEKYGYEKTSVDEIARRAHKAKASIYYHFAGKSEIFRAVLEKEFGDVESSLEDIRLRYKDDIKLQVSIYLTERMRLLHSSKVWWQYMRTSYIYGKNEISDVVESVRSGFDSREYSYFIKICEEGKKLGILSDNIGEEDFARLMQALLKGLEVQLSVTGDYEALKSVHDSMVEIIIFNKGRDH